MLANLAGIVLFGQDGLSTGDTWAEMTATFSATGVELRDEGLAAGLRTLELLLLRIGGRMPTEKLEGQVLILLSLLRSERFKALKLDKGLGAVTPAAIEHACNDNDTVYLSGREFFLILD